MVLIQNPAHAPVRLPGFDHLPEGLKTVEPQTAAIFDRLWKIVVPGNPRVSGLQPPRRLLGLALEGTRTEHERHSLCEISTVHCRLSRNGQNFRDHSLGQRSITTFLSV